LISDNERKVYEVLEQLGIAYEQRSHKAVFTSEEADEVKLDLKGQHCKNLFVRNKQGNRHYLIIITHTKTADLKAVAREIGSSRLSFASEERLMKYLGLTPGSVGPFGLLNDSEKHVSVVLDEDLKNSDYICFHPNTNTATVSIRYEDFEKFLKWCGNSVRYTKI